MQRTAQGRYLVYVFDGPTAKPFIFGPPFGKHWKIALMSFAAGASVTAGEFSFYFISDVSTSESLEGLERMPLVSTYLFTNGTTVPVVGGGTMQPAIAGLTQFIVPNNIQNLYLRYPQACGVTINGLAVGTRSELKMLVFEDDIEQPLCLP